MIPTTVERVESSTADHVNEQIRHQTEANIRHYADRGTEAIEQRLAELDREWDVERFLEANASALVVVGSLLGATVNRRFFALPAVVGAFLFQHAVQGWCPPLPVIRRLGYRTATEIEQERYALKALRGDFQQVTETENHVDEVIAAVRR